MVSTMTPRAAPMAPDDRRQAIVEAVIPLLASHGAGVTTRQIAEAAGVAEGTIFRVFPDKCALMHAAARATMDPESGRIALQQISADLGLHATVRAVAEQLMQRMEQVIAVMMAVRGSGFPQDHDGRGRGGPRGDGPPDFMVEANRALLGALADVFDRHRADLRVEPDRAALMLRSLVFGSRHPGQDQAAILTAEEIADVLVVGVARAEAGEH